MSEWKKVRLGEVADIQCGPFGSQLHESDYVLSGGTPIVTVEHLGNRHFTTQNLPLVSDEDKERLSRYVMSFGDVIFSRVGSVDRCSFVDQGSDGWMFSGRCIRVRPNKEIDGEYLYYYLSNPRVKQIVRDMAVGTTMPSINSSIMGDVPIEFPPLPTQRKIAAVLGALDDKIENNRKICANLEAQAQAIFKSWFVDFEPFGGKMPQGWKEVPLSSIATYLNGLAMQKYRPSDDEDSLPVLKIKELRQGFCDSASERCSASIDPRYVIHDGDVIFSWSGSLLVDFWCGGTAGLNQHLFKVYSDKYDKWFVYSWTNHYLASFIKIAADKATTMGHITRDHLDDAKVCIPFDSDIEQVGRVMKPLYDEIIAKRIESRSLAALRDALLPKLMSGELDVEQVKF